MFYVGIQLVLLVFILKFCIFSPRLLKTHKSVRICPEYNCLHHVRVHVMVRVVVVHPFTVQPIEKKQSKAAEQEENVSRA